MTPWLKQSTAVDVGIGPFVDDTDGKTAETGLTITQPDIRLKKNGGAWAQKSAAQTLSHEENGWYAISLSTTDTDTLGILIVAVHEAGALPVWEKFMVVPANVYDSFFGSDFLQIDVAQWLNATAPAMTGDAFARLGAPAGASVSADVAAAKTDTAAIKTKTDNLPTDPADHSLVIAGTDAIMTRLGAPAGASVSADVAAVKTDTAAIKVRTDLSPEGIKKNTARADFTFVMTDSTTHEAKTGLVNGDFTKKYRIGSGSANNLSGTITEVDATNFPGLYSIDLTAGELNGDMIVLRFSAAGADILEMTIKTSA